MTNTYINVKILMVEDKGDLFELPSQLFYKPKTILKLQKILKLKKILNS